MTPADLEAIVTDYYSRVDSEDVDWVLALFAEDAVYDRADARYVGKDAITRFYRGERKILGAHRLETVTATERTVMVNGVFAGVGHDGSAKCVGFADVWEFADTGLIANRKTYLALGSGYVKE